MRRMLACLALFASSAAAQATSDTLMGTGVSIELARLRARTINDVRYDLRLDLTRYATDTAAGSVIVTWKRTGTDDAVIDFRGPDVSSIVVNDSIVSRSAYNGAHIRIPASLLRTGDNMARIAFKTMISPSGASIIRSHDPDGSDYLYTLLVPADANQLFPCFDQPDLKARVTLGLSTTRDWIVVANGSTARTVDVDMDDIATRRGTSIRSWTFTETKPISTYLIAFAAGPWEKRSSTVGNRTINIFVRKSRIKEADTDTLLALNHRAVSWMESYFGIPYPFEKFDFVLAPAFPFGGMEHPGAIFFNENSFIFRERPTPARKIGRFSTILHEVAHQWFGDLVTMKWFDDLWLKEGFATYMAAKAQADLNPAAGAWKTFYQGNKPSAYAVDQTTGTNSLWQKLANLDQAKSNYGAIVYNKAPSVLKQLNYLVGDSLFQIGVRSFLREHSYANATWQDLLGAIGKASNRSFDDFGKNFMLRPGMPLVEQRLTVKNGVIEKLELVQKPAQAMSGADPWPMRTQVLLSYANGTQTKLAVELRGTTTEVIEAKGRPAPDYVFANADDYGYFLTLLDSGSVRALERGALGKTTDPFLRTMLWGALWDLVRNAQLDPSRFATLVLNELQNENDEQLFPNIIGRLSRTMSTYLSPTAEKALVPRAEDAFWNGAHDAARPYGVRRAYLDAFIGVAETPKGIARLDTLFKADSAAGEAVRDPMRWDIVNHLMVLDAPIAKARLAAQIARDTTADGKRRAFVAGAAEKTAAAKKAYFNRYFADKTLNEEWASGSLGAFNAEEHAELTLPYLRPALDSLPYIQVNRRIFYLQSWLSAFIGGQRSAEALQIVNRYLADHPALPLDLKQKVLQTVDDLDRTVAIRARWK